MRTGRSHGSDEMPAAEAPEGSRDSPFVDSGDRAWEIRSWAMTESAGEVAEQVRDRPRPELPDSRRGLSSAGRAQPDGTHAGIRSRHSGRIRCGPAPSRKAASASSPWTDLPNPSAGHTTSPHDASLSTALRDGRGYGRRSCRNAWTWWRLRRRRCYEFSEDLTPDGGLGRASCYTKSA